MMSSDVLFGPQPRDNQLTVTEEQRNQDILKSTQIKWIDHQNNFFLFFGLSVDWFVGKIKQKLQRMEDQSQLRTFGADADKDESRIFVLTIFNMVV